LALASVRRLTVRYGLEREKVDFAMAGFIVILTDGSLGQSAAFLASLLLWTFPSQDLSFYA